MKLKSQYNDWMFSASLHECNKYMFDEQLECDITFEFPPPGGLEFLPPGGSVNEFLVPTGPPTYVQAHRYILICRSPVFRAMLTGPMASDHIKVADVDPEAFKEMLRFLYYEDVSLDEDNVSDVLYAAKKYMLTNLIDKCGQYVQRVLQVDNAAIALELSMIFDMKELKAKCLHFIQRNTVAVLNNDDFLQIQQGTLLELLKLDVLCVTEEDLIRACLRWANQKCEENDQELSGANQREVLGDALYALRFPVVPFNELCKSVISSGLLTYNEEIDLVLYVNRGVKNPSLPFPTERRRRGLNLKNNCTILDGTSSSTGTALAGRWYKTKMVSTEDVYLHSVSVLVPASYVLKATVAVEQDGKDIAKMQATIQSKCLMSRCGPYITIAFGRPVKVKAGEVILKVNYKFMGGTYGSVPGGVPVEDAIDCCEVKFKFDKEDHTHISGFDFTLADDWESFSPEDRKIALM